MPNFTFNLKNPEVFNFIVENGGADVKEKFPNGIPASLTVESEDLESAKELLKVFTHLEMWEIKAE